MPLTVFSGLDEGEDTWPGGLSKRGPLDGSRGSLQGVRAPHRGARPCCHRVTDRGENGRHTAVEVQHETSTVDGAGGGKTTAARGQSSVLETFAQRKL